MGRRLAPSNLAIPALLLLSFLLTNSSWAQRANVTDADTLIIDNVPYRFDGVDAPETDQLCLDETGAVWTCGIEARDKLVAFVASRLVRCDDKGRDTVYGNRRIGVCWIEGEAISLNQWLVREGWALNSEPYARGRFVSDQAQAKDEGRGLWKGCFSAPQEQRRWKKGAAILLGRGCPTGDDRATRNFLFPDHPAMPPGCSIKGKTALRALLTGHRGIYHNEGCRSYKRTKNPDRWFCSEEEATAEGFRKSFTC